MVREEGRGGEEEGKRRGGERRGEKGRGEEKEGKRRGRGGKRRGRRGVRRGEKGRRRDIPYTLVVAGSRVRGGGVRLLYPGHGC